MTDKSDLRESLAYSGGLKDGDMNGTTVKRPYLVESLRTAVVVEQGVLVKLPSLGVSSSKVGRQ